MQLGFLEIEDWLKKQKNQRNCSLRLYWQFFELKLGLFWPVI